MDIFENICRTCGSDCSDALNIFVDSVVVMEKNLKISEIIAGCQPASSSLPPLSIDDDYPKQICRICYKKFIMIYEFNQKWLAANSEFGVALKFEHRRKRARESQPVSKNAEHKSPIKFSVKTVDANDDEIETIDNNMFKHEPNEFVELEMISENELSNGLIPKPNLKANYQCTLCQVKFYTIVAYQVHQKAIHRDWQFMDYPGE